jgi:hypothetical protein
MICSIWDRNGLCVRVRPSAVHDRFSYCVLSRLPTIVPPLSYHHHHSQEDIKQTIGSGMMISPSFLSNRSIPATEALELSLKVLENPRVPQDDVTPTRKERTPMISSRGFKRSQSKMSSSFSLSDLLDATKPVEESIAFPCIEWNFDDDEDDSDTKSFPSISFPSDDDSTPPSYDFSDLDDDLFSHRTKRPCSGLLRSKKIGSDLASFMMAHPNR